MTYTQYAFNLYLFRQAKQFLEIGFSGLFIYANRRLFMFIPPMIIIGVSIVVGGFRPRSLTPGGVGAYGGHIYDTSLNGITL